MPPTEVPHGIRARLDARLAGIRSSGLARSLREPEGIDLSSNDYLGLANHPLVRERMRAAIDEYGCGSTGSRLLRGERRCFSEIERRFAAFKGAEASLYFSSGYLANLAVLSTFLEEDDVVLFDRLNHASLIDGMKLGGAKKVIYRHCDVEDVKRCLERYGRDRQTFLVTESLFSMDGDTAPLVEYASLCEDAGTALIVDEAHAVGVYGATGSGMLEALGLGSRAFLSINSAGKALGVSGAFVTGSAQAIDYLLQRGRSFIFSTAPPPSVAAAIDAALDVLVQEPERLAQLHELCGYLRGLLREYGFEVEAEGSQIIPIVLGDTVRAVSVATALQAAGFDVRAIRPPTVPEGTSRLRISVNTGLTREILNRFAETLVRTVKEHGA